MAIHAARLCYLCGVAFDVRRCRVSSEAENKRFGEVVSCIPFHCGHITHGRTGSDPTAMKSMIMESRFLQIREHISIKNGSEFFAGYNGYRISGEEMAGINKAICIKLKPSNPINEERDGYSSIDDDTVTFLTGVGTLRLFDMTNITPARYGIGDTCVNNSGSIDPGPQFGVPIHVACFEIFKKVSTQRLGKVDIDGLYRHSRRRANDAGPVMRRGGDVRKCQGRRWEHKCGTEYLAANPLNTPSVTPEIELYIGRKNIENFVFTELGPRNTSPTDPFSKLPRELRDEILLSLDRKSVANLRLSSGAFQALPQYYFRNLVKQEMQWLSELDSILPTGRGSVDWYGLYLRVRELLREVKGLRNRERIWKDVSWLVNNVNDLNAELGDRWEEEWLVQRWAQRGDRRTYSIGSTVATPPALTVPIASGVMS